MKVYRPMSGTNSEVAGILSAISSMNTEKASNTVNPSVTFSPLSAGKKNPAIVKMDNNTQGIMTLNV